MLLLHGDASASTFLGYDLPRLHAALNDFPSALLVTALLFEVLWLATRREGFRTVAFWTLIVGALGGAAAVVSGLLAEDTITHGTAIHEIMETHETYGLVTLGIFGVLALWHILRGRTMGMGERILALIVMVAGTGTMIYTAREGGELVFDHAAGVSDEKLEAELRNRAGGHEHAPGEEHGDEVPAAPAGADSLAGTAGDTATPAHEHAPGAPAHEH